MGLGVFLVQVVAVVGGHQRQVKLAGHLQEPFIGDILFRECVLLQLDVVAAGEDSANTYGPRQRASSILFVPHNGRQLPP